MFKIFGTADHATRYSQAFDKQKKLEKHFVYIENLQLDSYYKGLLQELPDDERYNKYYQ